MLQTSRITDQVESSWLVKYLKRIRSRKNGDQGKEGE